jgi:hypothetical protein
MQYRFASLMVVVLVEAVAVVFMVAESLGIAKIL